MDWAGVGRPWAEQKGEEGGSTCFGEEGMVDARRKENGKRPN